MAAALLAQPALAQERPGEDEAVAVVAQPALAQERPGEDEMFGAPGPAEPPERGAVPAPSAGPAGVATSTATDTGVIPTATATATATSTAPVPESPEAARDFLNLGSTERVAALSAEVAPEDPLRIGGQFYLRAQTLGLQGETPADWSFASPSLLDVYLDVRPNDRVRAFTLGRMSFDPTLPETATGLGTETGADQIGGSIQGSPALSSLFGAQQTRTPRVVLDQMWLRFDLARRVFVTAGRQHVRWGTGRFWTPTDFLHIRRRNPLAVFDARVGTGMLKLHVPWEARGWNFYACAVTEGAEATATLGEVAGAARAEIVLGTTELGLGGLFQKGREPKLAADISTGLWDLDLYGEVALRHGGEIDRVTVGADPASVTLGRPPAGDVDRAALQAWLGPAVDQLYPVGRCACWRPQAVGGLSYQVLYADRDVLTMGAEYFYNGLGYSDPDAYPGLLLPHTRELEEPASFFYLGRHYAGVFVTAPAPYSWDNTTFTLSTLANLSDRSGISRLDYTRILLTHLRFEAFASVRWGARKGEFRFGSDALTIGGVPLAGPRSPALVDFGVALRVSI